MDRAGEGVGVGLGLGVGLGSRQGRCTPRCGVCDEGAAGRCPPGLGLWVGVGLRLRAWVRLGLGFELGSG